MKILVAVKRVIDPYVKIRIKSDHSGVETQQVKMSMNPFDEIALEEAIRLQEKNIASEVIAVSIGTEANQETLRHALALGATRGILIKTDKHFESLNIAKILHRLVLNESPGLVLLGKQSIDDDNNQTAQMLAALLKWPQGTFASSLSIEDGRVKVSREIDEGLETLSLALPAVISADLRLNEPRYATLPNIMKAKQKPLDILDCETLNLDLKEHIKILSVSSPPVRKKGEIVGSVQELIHKLKQEAKVLL